MAITKSFICLALIALIACHRKTETKEITNTVVQEIEKRHTWKRESVFNYEFASNQNSFLFKGNLLCLNNNYYVSRLDSNGGFMYGAPAYYGPNYPIGVDYSNIFAVEHKLVFLHERYIDTKKRIDIELRSDLRDFNSFKRIWLDSANLEGLKTLLVNDYTYRTNKFVSDLGFAIIPAAFDSLYSSKHEFLLLKNMDLVDSVFNYKDVSKFAKRISFKGIDHGQNSQSDLIYVIDSSIFISSVGEGLYKLDDSGNIQRISDYAFSGSMFKFNNKLYASGYESTDNGYTWKRLGDGVFINGLGFQSFMIKNIPYFLLGVGVNYGTGIARVASDTSGKLYYEFLDTDGLENNSITSLSLFKDRLYATTLSGVYSTDFKSLKVKQ